MKCKDCKYFKKEKIEKDFELYFCLHREFTKSYYGKEGRPLPSDGESPFFCPRKRRSK